MCISIGEYVEIVVVLHCRNITLDITSQSMELEEENCASTWRNKESFCISTPTKDHFSFAILIKACCIFTHMRVGESCHQ